MILDDMQTQGHRDHRGKPEFVIVPSLCPQCLCVLRFVQQSDRWRGNS